MNQITILLNRSFALRVIYPLTLVFLVVSANHSAAQVIRPTANNAPNNLSANKSQAVQTTNPKAVPTPTLAATPTATPTETLQSPDIAKELNQLVEVPQEMRKDLNQGEKN